MILVNIKAKKYNECEEVLGEKVFYTLSKCMFFGPRKGTTIAGVTDNSVSLMRTLVSEGWTKQPDDMILQSIPYRKDKLLFHWIGRGHYTSIIRAQRLCEKLKLRSDDEWQAVFRHEFVDEVEDNPEPQVAPAGNWAPHPQQGDGMVGMGAQDEPFPFSVVVNGAIYAGTCHHIIGNTYDIMYHEQFAGTIMVIGGGHVDRLMAAQRKLKAWLIEQGIAQNAAAV
jgi:hypothetical protein